MTDSLGSAIKRTSSRPMCKGNETWTEKDKRIINVKTTRNNLGKLIKYNICILQSIRFIESDWLRANSRKKKVVGQPIQTLSTGKKVCITIQTSLLNADAAVFDDST